jgi:hypothetical protein
MKYQIKPYDVVQILSTPAGPDLKSEWLDFATVRTYVDHVSAKKLDPARFRFVTKTWPNTVPISFKTEFVNP